MINQIDSNRMISLHKGQIVQYSDLAPWEDCEVLEFTDDTAVVRFIEDGAVLAVYRDDIREHPVKN